MGLLVSNYRHVQEKIKRLATDSSFDNSGGTTIWQERKSLLNQNALTLYLMT